MILKVFKKDKDKRAIYKCDSCGDEYEVSWYYLNKMNRLDTQLCRKCTIKENNTVEKRKATCLEKYGHENPMQVAEYKDKFVSANKDTYKNQRVDLEEIKKVYESEGYTLLETEYKNNTHKMKCICPNGHEFLTTWNMWTQGKRCKKCYQDNLKKTIKHINKPKTRSKRVAHNKFDYDFVKDFFEKEGYTLLSDTYEGSNTKSKVRCPRGHEWEIDFSRFKSGVRCKYCNYEDHGVARRLKYKYVKKYFEDEGYILLSTEFKGTEQKLDYICPSGHKNSITFHNFKDLTNRCPDCSQYKNTKCRYEDVREYIEKEEYILISDEYINNRQKLNLICPEGHECSINYHDFLQGYRCKKCSCNGISKSELEVFEFIKQYYPEVESGNRSLISPLELDIVIPEKKIAVEYCGLYWHSETMKKDRLYHLNKLNLCNDVDYKLITIFEDEWTTKQEIIKSRLKNIMGVNNNTKIYARKCKIGEIDTQTARNFCNDNHLQGYGESSVKLGLFFNDELVSIMTFSKGSISKGSKSKEKTYELNRFCSKLGYNVVGGASRLLKYFITNYNPHEIYSYADRRWSTGNLYEKLGFEKVRNTPPNYWYIKNNGYERQHRFNFRKSVLKDKLESFNSELTEYENMLNNKYRRLWDCGNIKYSMIL